MFYKFLLLLIFLTSNAIADIKTTWIGWDGEKVDLPDYINLEFIEKSQVLSVGYFTEKNGGKVYIGRNRNYIHFTVTHPKFYKTVHSNKILSVDIMSMCKQYMKHKEIYHAKDGRGQGIMHLHKKGAEYEFKLMNLNFDSYVLNLTPDQAEKFFNIINFIYDRLGPSHFDPSWFRWEKNPSEFKVIIGKEGE